MKTYYVYLLECDDGSYYAGITNDVDRRVAEHNEGLDPKCYTYTRRPVRCVFASDFKEVTDAIAFEKQVKGWSRKKKRALIAGNYAALPVFARNYRDRGFDKLSRASTGSA